MRNCADKRKADRVERTHLFTLLDNFLEAVILINESPVVHLAIFQNTLNDIARRTVHRNRRWICIPKKILGKLLYKLSTAHSYVFNECKGKKYY